MKKLVNGVLMDCTEQDILEISAREAAWNAGAQDRLMKEFTDALSKAINDKAIEKSYQSAVTCATYANSTNAQWAAESQAFLLWRDVALEYAYEYLALAESGEIQNPTIEDFLAGVPALTWPELPSL